MRRIASILASASIAFLMPVIAWAQLDIPANDIDQTTFQVTVNPGITGPRTVPEIIAKIITIFHEMALGVVLMVFIVGAFYMLFPGGSETMLSKGKTLIKSSLIAIAIISGSWLLLSSFVSLLI